MGQIYKFYSLHAESAPHNIRYIGVTAKDTVQQRFYGHKYCAMHDNKRHLPVHKWMYKHYEAGDDIKVTYITECDESQWEDMEKYLIKKYREEGHDLLNVDEGGRGVITKEKRNSSGTERSAKAHEKAVVLMDNGGKVIEICNSVKEACSKYNLSKTAVGNVLSGRSKTAGGYFITTKEIYESPDFNPVEFVRSKNSESKVGKFIYEFDLDGTLLNVYKGFAQIGYDYNCITRALKNKWNYKNHFWSRSPDFNIKDFRVRKELN